MPGKWSTLWSSQSGPITKSLAQWRQTNKARMILPNLATVSTRKDLYDYVIVTFNNPSSKVGGKRHLLELERVVAPMLNSGESVKVSIVKWNNQDYLEFS